MSQTQDRQNIWIRSRNELQSLDEHLTSLCVIAHHHGESNEEAILLSVRETQNIVSLLKTAVEMVSHAETQQTGLIVEKTWSSILNLSKEVQASLAKIHKLLRDGSSLRTLLQGAKQQLEHFNIHIDYLRDSLSAPTKQPPAA